MSEDLQAVFDRFDRDRNGHIDQDEFTSLIASLGTKMNEDDLRTAFLALDVNQNGLIDFSEFCAWWVRRIKDAR